MPPPHHGHHSGPHHGMPPHPPSPSPSPSPGWGGWGGWGDAPSYQTNYYPPPPCDPAWDPTCPPSAVYVVGAPQFESYGYGHGRFYADRGGRGGYPTGWPDYSYSPAVYPVCEPSRDPGCPAYVDMATGAITIKPRRPWWTRFQRLAISARRRAKGAGFDGQFALDLKPATPQGLRAAAQGVGAFDHAELTITRAPDGFDAALHYGGVPHPRGLRGAAQGVGSSGMDQIEDIFTYPVPAATQVSVTAVGDFWGDLGDILTHPADDVDAVAHAISDAADWAVHAFGDAGKFIADHEPILRTFKSIAEGKNLLQAIEDGANAGVDTLKLVGPIAASIAPLIPGIGPEIGMAISFAVALADGQPISDALLSAAAGAIPGGALAQTAFRSAATIGGDLLNGKSLDAALLDGARKAAIAAGNAVGVPSQVTAAAFDAGTSIAYGKSLQDAGFDIGKELLGGSNLAQTAVDFAHRVANAAASGHNALEALKDEAFSAVKRYGSQMAEQALKPAVDAIIADANTAMLTATDLAHKVNVPVEVARLAKAAVDVLPAGVRRANPFYREAVVNLQSRTALQQRFGAYQYQVAQCKILERFTPAMRQNPMLLSTLAAAESACAAAHVASQKATATQTAACAAWDKARPMVRAMPPAAYVNLQQLCQASQATAAAYAFAEHVPPGAAPPPPALPPLPPELQPRSSPPGAASALAARAVAGDPAALAAIGQIYALAQQGSTVAKAFADAFEHALAAAFVAKYAPGAPSPNSTAPIPGVGGAGRHGRPMPVHAVPALPPAPPPGLPGPGGRQGQSHPPPVVIPPSPYSPQPPGRQGRSHPGLPLGAFPLAPPPGLPGPGGRQGQSHPPPVVIPPSPYSPQPPGRQGRSHPGFLPMAHLLPGREAPGHLPGLPQGPSWPSPSWPVPAGPPYRSW